MAVWDSVKLVGTVAFNLFMDAVEFLGGKMDWVIPILGGVVAAIGAFKIINTIIDLYKSWQIVTKLMAVAQAALNLVLDLNPIGIVVLAIGTLVAAGIYLYQNWDTVKDKMSSIMDSIEQAAASMVNGIIDNIDWLID
jgi:phage-related minor tail protein